MLIGQDHPDLRGGGPRTVANPGQGPNEAARITHVSALKSPPGVGRVTRVPMHDLTRTSKSSNRNFSFFTLRVLGGLGVEWQAVRTRSACGSPVMPPLTRPERCPEPAQVGPPTAKRDLRDICNAEKTGQAAKAVKALAQQYGATFPKAVKKITDDEVELPAFYDFPTERGIRLRGPRTRSTRPPRPPGCEPRSPRARSRVATLAMVLKLVESAQAHWRAVNTPDLVALGRVRARFERGELVERPGAPRGMNNLNRPTG